MTKRARSHVDDLRGASRLAIEATQGITSLVEVMHRTIASGPNVLGRPLEVPATAITQLVYGSIRGFTQLVGTTIDTALAELAPLLGESVPGAEREAVLSALNGVLGDYLSDTQNPLAINMRFRSAGQALTLEPDALKSSRLALGPKLLVMVHGSSMNDLQWRRRGHDHGAALAEELGYTPVYVHYNSGRHISSNGRELSGLLEQLVLAWPERLQDLAIVGHSMGGLVARSACHYGEVEGHSWRRQLRRLVCLGSPHHGAALERGGNWIDVLLQVSRYSAPFAQLGKIRSAGVTDLRFGNVIDEHWLGRDRFLFGSDQRAPVPLPSGVKCYAIAGTTTLEARPKLSGDGLVSVDSALGRHRNPMLDLQFPAQQTWVGLGIGHVEMLARLEVYETIRDWFSAENVS